MCGIAGFISWSGQPVDSSRLAAMSDALQHRGPDGSGIWIDEDQKVGMVHRRLSIIDLHPSAGQPMTRGDRFTIVYNGEIYNYRELRDELKRSGFVFNTQSDTEVLLCLYQVYGRGMLALLDGMFAFAIWDSVKSRLFCARDRFGEKPFYYAITGDGFWFASEMKALWAAGVSKIPDSQRIFRYLAYGQLSLPDELNRTFFVGIQQLKPAHWLDVGLSEVSLQSAFWSLPIPKEPVDMNEKEACDQFLHLMEESIRLRLRSDVPVGSSLSGGLDSSTIVSLIQSVKESAQVQKTFSARFVGFVKDEGKYIDELTSRLGCEAYAVFLNPEKLLQEMDRVAFHQEEPFGSTSVVAQWEVMRLARDHGVKVLLDGQGADEVLAGYHHFFQAYFKGLFMKDRSAWIRESVSYEKLHGVRSENKLSFIADALAPGLRNRARRFRNFMKPPLYIRQFNKDFLIAQATGYDTPADNHLSAALNRALNGGELQVLLRYADRNSMAFGREVRLPFLSHRLVEFVFSLPDDLKIRGGWTKYLLRSAMSDMLPDSICWRPEKVGFEPPQQKKIRSEWVRESISILTDQRILDPGSVDHTKDWDYVQTANLFKPIR